MGGLADKQMDGCQNYGPFLGSLIKYGTYYLGYPRRDHNFDNHPNMSVSMHARMSVPGRTDGCMDGHVLAM